MFSLICFIVPFLFHLFASLSLFCLHLVRCPGFTDDSPSLWTGVQLFVRALEWTHMILSKSSSLSIAFCPALRLKMIRKWGAYSPLASPTLILCGNLISDLCLGLKYKALSTKATSPPFFYVAQRFLFFVCYKAFPCLYLAHYTQLVSPLFSGLSCCPMSGKSAHNSITGPMFSKEDKLTKRKLD